MTNSKGLIILALFLFPHFAHSEQCDHMEVFDASMNMCMPLSSKDMAMSMIMLQGNAFAVGISESGTRGRNALSAPHMIMADLGTSLSSSHYINLDFMGTGELWTMPSNGYPELLQIGEENKGVPYLDAQHPHSSPIMGLTLSDTFRFNQESKNHLKISFSPRGESTDGPIAFMHRVTGMVNPDAPLGHHIAQDVGHISSTVFAAGIKLEKNTLQASTFDGTEPQPTSTSLEMKTPNSWALRFIHEFNSDLMIMGSFASINNPETHATDIPFEYRYSASIYNHIKGWGKWSFHNTLIFGLITNLDHASSLTSLGEEFLFENDKSKIWGRVESLQRTPDQLQIANSNPNQGQWVEALTLGYTYALTKSDDGELSVGSSATVDFLPPDFSAAYGTSAPLTGKVFLQLSGMKMWEL